MKKKISIALMVAVFLLSMAIPVMAWSGTSQPVYYPGGDYITADIWLGNGDPSFSFSSSSYLHGYNPARANWIKNVVNVTGNGIGVSLYGLSAGSGTSNTSASWTNYNAYWSGLSGNITMSGLLWSVSGSSTASAYAAGTVRLTTASTTKYW